MRRSVHPCTDCLLANQITELFPYFSQYTIICSYSPIVRSIRKNIRTEVLKYGLNEVRSERKAELRIFSRMDRTNWSIRVLLYRHNQRPKTESSLNSVLNIFVSSLNAAVGREFFSSSHISFKVKRSIKKVKLA